MGSNNKKKTREDWVEVGKKQGLTLLSETVGNASSKGRWKCDNPEHSSFFMSYLNIYMGHGCAFCHGSQKYTMNDVREFEKTVDFVCTSAKYSKGMDWHRDECNHTWVADLCEMKRRPRCPICNFSEKYTIDGCIEWAKNKNGECEETEYVSANVPMKWKCNVHDSHWTNSWANVHNQNQWCDKCYRDRQGDDRKLPPQEYHITGERKGYIWLGPEVSSTGENTWWQCRKCGHKRFSSYTSIKFSVSCFNCNKPNKEDYNLVGKDRGYTWIGVVLPKKTIDKTVWLCGKGHTWEMSYHNLSHGQGCIHCNPGYSKAELVIREYLVSECGIAEEDMIYNDREQLKPKELDIYIPYLNFAIEFNGQRYHSFERLLRRFKGDVEEASNYHQMKTDRCSALGIILMHIYEKDWIADKESVLESIKNEIVERLKSAKGE